MSKEMSAKDLDTVIREIRTQIKKDSTKKCEIDITPFVVKRKEEGNIAK